MSGFWWETWWLMMKMICTAHDSSLFFSFHTAGRCILFQLRNKPFLKQNKIIIVHSSGHLSKLQSLMTSQIQLKARKKQTDIKKILIMCNLYWFLTGFPSVFVPDKLPAVFFWRCDSGFILHHSEDWACLFYEPAVCVCPASLLQLPVLPQSKYLPLGRKKTKHC